MLTKEDLDNQCQLIQDDLDCILDGIESTTMANVCQVIVDRFQILKDNLG